MSKDNNQHLWNSFIRLGDMIGDGMHHEEPWISKEYKKLSRILIPEIKEAEQKRRAARAISINAQMVKLLDNRKCHCGGELKQSRSGSKVCRCVSCNARYVAKPTRRR